LSGAVTVRVNGERAAALAQKLNGVAGVQRTLVVADEPAAGVVRAFPRAGNADGALAREIHAAFATAQVEELHTEEGRLDEVFRRLTLPEDRKENRS
jgi:ABC-2 type transport system ATP-binding protein